MKRASLSATPKWRPSTSKATPSIPSGITPSSPVPAKHQVEALISRSLLNCGRPRRTPPPRPVAGFQFCRRRCAPCKLPIPMPPRGARLSCGARSLADLRLRSPKAFDDLVDELGSKGEAVLAGPHFAALAVFEPDAKTDDVEAFEVASRDADFLAGVFSDGRQLPVVALAHELLPASSTARTAPRSDG